MPPFLAQYFLEKAFDKHMLFYLVPCGPSCLAALRAPAAPPGALRASARA